LRIHVGDAGLVTLLLDHFEAEADCIAIQVGETEIEVSLLGSYAAEMHDALVSRRVTEFRLRHAQLRPLGQAPST
jgi:hypothetical protein